MSKSGKPVAVVSGASRGIGRAIALKLTKEGYAVVGLYRSNDKAAASLSDIDMRKVDVGDEVAVKKTIASIANSYGRVDVVVNNAGIDIPGEIETYRKETWDEMVATDLTSVFLMSKYSIPYLKKAENAVIVNISSRLGLDEYSEPGFVAYCALKAAVNNFTAGLARELKKHNIRVNGVIPAPTKTDLFDAVFTPEEEAEIKTKGKLGTPDEVADLVLSIVNDHTINGQLVFDKRVNS